MTRWMLPLSNTIFHLENNYRYCQWIVSKSIGNPQCLLALTEKSSSLLERMCLRYVYSFNTWWLISWKIPGHFRCGVQKKINTYSCTAFSSFYKEIWLRFPEQSFWLWHFSSHRHMCRHITRNIYSRLEFEILESFPFCLVTGYFRWTTVQTAAVISEKKFSVTNEFN